MTSSKMAAKMTAILDFNKKLKFAGKMRKLQICLLELCNVIELNILMLLVAFYMFFSLKNCEKHAFLFKYGLTSCYL